MFDRKHTRARNAERIAGQAWEQLVSTVDEAGSAARSATSSARRRAKRTADDMSERMGSASSEARRRAGLAYDALAGRQQSRPWGWLAVAAIFGAIIGWLGTIFGRQLAARSDEDALERSIADLPMSDQAITH
jgi:ElaB/YqjD/DUF883 family membrane-anchored ribosome-binding protein